MTTLPSSFAASGSKPEQSARPMCPLHRLFEISRDGPALTHHAGGRFAAIATAVYGFVAYAAFLAAITYAIGFVTGIGVPKSINSGAAAPFGQAVVVNALLLSVFVLQHTIMARPWFKAWWTLVIPAAIERSTFVLAASASLGLAFWLWQPLPQVVWTIQAPALRIAILCVGLAGWAIVFASSFMVNHFDLFGLRQVMFRLLGREYQPVGFKLRGFYRVTRHPLMVGFLIAFWAAPTMTVGHFLFAILTTGYIFLGTWLEERDLIAQHGESYLEYRRRVRGFIPIPPANHGEAA